MLFSSFVVLMAVLGFGAFIFAYFAPTLIAVQRDCEHAGRIFAINALTGWTVVGWLIALSMSLKDDSHEDGAHIHHGMTA